MSRLASCLSIRSILLSTTTVALSLVLAHSIALAQDLDDVTISGRVLDENQQIISDAIIRLRNDETDAERTTTSDSEGRYRFIDLAPGAYSLFASFGSRSRPAITVRDTIAGQNIQLDIIT